MGSYVVAPILFLYLHAQLLFALSVLARKVREFESLAAREGLPRRREYENWFSAFSAVQSIVSVSSKQRVLARVLAWIGVEAIPLFLLLIVNVIFVLYQSWITPIHHAVLLVDLILVALFVWGVNWSDLDPRTWSLRRCVTTGLWLFWRVPILVCVLILITHACTPPVPVNLEENG